MKNSCVELILTLAVGTWVLYNLVIDLPVTEKVGWHTVSYPEHYIYIKLFFLLLTILFFAYRVVRLMKKILLEKAQSK